MLVLVEGAPVGRVWTARLADDELRLVDISLRTAHRGAGLGAALLRDLIARADAEGRRLVLHVARDNPAQRLYERLGLNVTAEDALNLRMERPPSAP